MLLVQQYYQYTNANVRFLIYYYIRRDEKLTSL